MVILYGVHFTSWIKDWWRTFNEELATRLVPGIGHLSYIDRLRTLNIPSLAYRRKRGTCFYYIKCFRAILISASQISLHLPAIHLLEGILYRKIFKSRFSCRARSTFFSTLIGTLYQTMLSMHLQFLHSKNNWIIIGLVLCTVMTFNLYFVFVFILIVV